jgi:molybdenum cofactor synthesis domain-containing protein
VDSPRTAAALIIGSELLSGKVAETNVLLLARTLRSMGIVLDRVVIVLDEREVIAEEVRQLSSSHDVVFTSGGMGPTHDDVTVQAVADAFRVATVVPELTRRLLEEHFGDGVTEGHLLMARVPEGARLVRAPNAPWPTVVMRNVWLLPGVPQIFARKMAVVRAELGSDRPFVSLSLRTNLDECTIKPHLDRAVVDHPEVAIGSYPQWREKGYRTEVTFDGAKDELVRRARDALAGALPSGSVEPADE